MQLTIEFLRITNMEDSCLLLIIMPLNANTLILETKKPKTQGELYIVTNEMTNTVEHFGKKNRTTKQRQL